MAFAREAGGAAAIGPVCTKLIDEKWPLLLLSKSPGLNIFNRQNLTSVCFSKFTEKLLDELIQAAFSSKPDLILTSAASLPTLDMTERYLWKWGVKQGILSVAILDQWQNYALRFSGPDGSKLLQYLPDYIFVMDELAKVEMVREGIPESKIRITGQPAFDNTMAVYEAISGKVVPIKQALAIPEGYTVVAFIAEALRKDYGNSLGYDEQSVLRFAGDTLDLICNLYSNLKIFLLIKLHPENNFDAFHWASSKWPHIKVHVIQEEIGPVEVLAVSDLIVGMTSILLIESIIAGKLTVSLQFDSPSRSQLAATRVGAIPYITSESDGRKILELLLIDNHYRTKYLENQKRWKISKPAIPNVYNELCRIAEDRIEKRK